MTLYADNPNLKLKTVVTVKGDTEYRRNCKFIRQKYYRMNRDCHPIDGKWYTIDGGNIIYDHEKQAWVLKALSKGLVSGVVGFEEDGSRILGVFTPNPYNNQRVRIDGYGNQLALNEEILLRNGYVEDISVGVWYSKISLGQPGIKRAKTIRNERSFTDRGYNIEDNVKDFKNKIELYDNYSTIISKNTHLYAKYLGDITFGAELEISKGNLPEYLQNRTGVVICRDGSIDGGPELVTIPLTGAKGLQTLKDLTEYVQPRGEISIACSYHLHIGTIRMDKLFIVALYTLCRKIQDEIFTMFPYYKTDHRGIKRRNYNEKLESLGIHTLVRKDKESFETYLVDAHSKIFDFLAEGRITIDQFNKKTREHPMPRKWERQSRYRWANFMNMFFGHRNTCEFRLHTPTTNHHKTVNWLFICNAIVKYAERYAMEIITTKGSIPLKDVFGIYKTLNPTDKNAKFLSDYLYAYFVSRRKEFQRDLEKGDKLSDWDMRDDKSYKFVYSGVCGLI
jgi:hypothetical protein